MATQYKEAPLSNRSRLASNERGALMLPGIFMMLFLVAIFYALVGIGRTIVLREGMQDAADASAFSAAIMHARGMNLIVFINLLMAMLIAVLLTLRLAQTLLAIGVAALTFASFFTFGGASALIPPLTTGISSLQRAYKAAKPIILNLLKGLHAVQRATSVTVPWIAMGDGMLEASSHHPPAKGALALPGAIRLPVSPDKFSVLCDRATNVIVNLPTRAALDFAPESEHSDEDSGSGLFGKVVRRAIEALIKPTASYLCGDGSESPPKHEEVFKSSRPKPDGLELCETDPNSSTCQEAVRQSEAATPREGTGECTQHCEPDGPYALMARKARDVCNPHINKSLTSFVWQERSGEARFRYDGSEWKRVQDLGSSTKLFDKKKPPCRSGYRSNEEWNDSGPLMQEEPNPVCSAEIPKTRSPPALGDERTVKYHEVLRIFSCTEEITQSFDVAKREDALGGKEKNKLRRPHKVEDNLKLGAEAFQIRAIAFGDAPGPGKARKGVELVKRGTSSTKEDSAEEFRQQMVEAASLVGSISGAQAEYYFDHDGDKPRAEWMWNMHWTARLKHFRLPSANEEKKEQERRSYGSQQTRDNMSEYDVENTEGTPKQRCQDAGGSGCGETKKRAEFLNGWVRH